MVPGLTQFPQDTWAPVNLTFQAYHLMTNLGFLFPMMGVGIWMYWHRRRRDDRPMPKAVLWAASPPCSWPSSRRPGWWTAEIGRQPWMVWNVLRTTDGVSPNLTTGQVLASLIMFALLYALLLVLFLFLLIGRSSTVPTPLDDAQSATSDLPDTLREVFARSRATASKEGP